MLKQWQLRKVGPAANQCIDALCPSVHPVTSGVVGLLFLGYLCKQPWNFSFGADPRLLGMRPNQGNARHV